MVGKLCLIKFCSGPTQHSTRLTRLLELPCTHVGMSARLHKLHFQHLLVSARIRHNNQFMFFSRLRSTRASFCDMMAHYELTECRCLSNDDGHQHRNKLYTKLPAVRWRKLSYSIVAQYIFQVFLHITVRVAHFYICFLLNVFQLTYYVYIMFNVLK